MVRVSILTNHPSSPPLLSVEKACSSLVRAILRDFTEFYALRLFSEI